MRSNASACADLNNFSRSLDISFVNYQETVGNKTLSVGWQGEKEDFECLYEGCADKSLARPGRKQATATEDFDVHISYL